jgi:hypothetical protein
VDDSFVLVSTSSYGATLFIYSSRVALATLEQYELTLGGSERHRLSKPNDSRLRMPLARGNDRRSSYILRHSCQHALVHQCHVAGAQGAVVLMTIEFMRSDLPTMFVSAFRIAQRNPSHELCATVPPLNEFAPALKQANEKILSRKSMNEKEMIVRRCGQQDTIVEGREGIDESCLLLYGSSNQFSVGSSNDKTPSIPARRRSMPETATTCNKLLMPPVRIEQLAI